MWHSKEFRNRLCASWTHHECVYPTSQAKWDIKADNIRLTVLTGRLCGYFVWLSLHFLIEMRYRCLQSYTKEMRKLMLIYNTDAFSHPKQTPVGPTGIFFFLFIR
jgi:hypothetical protein